MGVVAVGGCDVTIGRIQVADDVAGSTSMGGRRSGALNTSFGGFFKASRRLCISVSLCSGLMKSVNCGGDRQKWRRCASL
uniref:Uncharacterized protein n=1 Tax=Romanomermis culicivorax TaxID=13658 RepID=A0A915KIX8_ROMCU